MRKIVNKRELTARMVSAGYTQRSLAEAIGVSKNTICTKINGKRAFNTEEVGEICNLLNITSEKDKVNIFLPQTSHNRDDQNRKEVI